MARFLAVAREQAEPPAARRVGRARRRRRGPVLAAGGLVVAVAAAVVGLHATARAAPEPSPTATTRPAVTRAAPASAEPTATSPAPSRPPTTAIAATPTGTMPPLQAREVPVVPVPTTAMAPTRAAPATPVPPSAAALDGAAVWWSVVEHLFSTRSAAFAAGRSDLLRDADAPGSALLSADQQLFDEAIRQAGFSRAAGLSFDLEAIRLLAVGPRNAQFEVRGRQGAYVLLGPGRSRAVPAGPRRVLTLQLSRTAADAPWLLAAGTAGPAS